MIKGNNFIPKGWWWNIEFPLIGSLESISRNCFKTEIDTGASKVFAWNVTQPGF